MHNFKFIIISFLLIFLLPFTYGGCYVAFSSGNNSREPEDDPQSEGVFIGTTSKATITSENAVQLTAGALAGGLRPHDSQPAVLDQDAANFQKDAFRILQLPLILADSLRKIEPPSLLIYFDRGDLIRTNGQFESSCGGSYSYSLQLNRRTKMFSAWLAFENYCAAGFPLAGNAEIEGSFHPGSGEFVSATFYFENISDGAHSLDGELAMDFSELPSLANFNAYSTDEQDGLVYWIKDYSLNLFEFANHVEIEVFGTFYHPEYGYVTLTTSDPLILHENDNWPAAGSIIVYGDHNTSAQLMALDHQHYGIQADSAGDGIFDYAYVK